MTQIVQRLVPVIVGIALMAGAVFYYQWSSVGTAAKNTDPHEQGGHEHGKEKREHGAEAVQLSDSKVAAAGIELHKAGPGVLHDSLHLNGILQANQETLVQVTPRFPGVAREIYKRIGDQA